MSVLRELKASVCIVTYNQSNYLRECLLSLVSQEVDFNYEIIIGDDASTDDTAVVVGEFQVSHPHLISYVRHEQNIGPTANYISVHGRARGEYVFHMDGDDLAFPGKIKKQIDFLERHSECVLAWHQVNVFNDAGCVTKVLHSDLSDVLNVNSITKRDFLRFGMLGAHSSTAYKRSAMPDLSFIKSEVLDYFVIGLILSSGKACRLEEILGGYRVNTNTTTASKKKSLYFKGSLIRELYCKHLDYFLLSGREGEYKEDIFLNALFNFFVDARFFRPSALKFLILSAKTFSISSIFQVFDYFKKALRLRK